MAFTQWTNSLGEKITRLVGPMSGALDDIVIGRAERIRLLTGLCHERPLVRELRRGPRSCLSRCLAISRHGDPLYSSPTNSHQGANMQDKFAVACLQNCAGPDMTQNVESALDLGRNAHRDGADLLCFPEFFTCLDMDDSGLTVGACLESEHPALARLRAFSRELGVWMLLGSLAIRAASGKLRNRSFLLDSTGEIVARYDKIHLFDVDLPNGEVYRESDIFEPGAQAVVAPTPWGLMGLSVCYDLRFAGLYRALAQAGALFLTVPAAFTKTTGEAHWHALLRARAIETGSYVIAPCQFGTHGASVSYGHSLVVDPWGEVVADAGDGPGYVLATVQPSHVTKVRSMIPALRHDRPFSDPTAIAISRASA